MSTSIIRMEHDVDRVGADGKLHRVSVAHTDNGHEVRVDVGSLDGAERDAWIRRMVERYA